MRKSFSSRLADVPSPSAEWFDKSSQAPAGDPCSCPGPVLRRPSVFPLLHPLRPPVPGANTKGTNAVLSRIPQEAFATRTALGDSASRSRRCEEVMRSGVAPSWFPFIELSVRSITPDLAIVRIRSRPVGRSLIRQPFALCRNSRRPDRRFDSERVISQQTHRVREARLRGKAIH
jgi:hypothetical protein